MLTWSRHVVRSGWIPVMNPTILTLHSTPRYKASECAPYKHACTELLTVLPGRQYVQSKLSMPYLKDHRGCEVYEFLCCCGDLP